MKNVLITIFFILSFAPMFAQTVPEKEIDFEGSFIMDDARSASLPIEAYLQDTQVVITFYVDLSDATVTIAIRKWKNVLFHLLIPLRRFLI